MIGLYNIPFKLGRLNIQHDGHKGEPAKLEYGVDSNLNLIEDAGERFQSCQDPHTMVPRDLRYAIILRQVNKDYNREPATPEYTVNRTQYLTEEALDAENRFQSCQDLSTMAVWNLPSKIATSIHCIYKTRDPK
jgi:hypothetical protein